MLQNRTVTAFGFSDWWDEVKPFSPQQAINWVEATRIAYNKNNPYGERLDFAQTVEMLDTSECNEDEDYRALKALQIMQDQAMANWYNSLSDLADPKRVAKIQQSFG